KLQEAQFVAFASKQRAKHSKGRGGNSDQHSLQSVINHSSDIELWIVQAATHGHLQYNPAIPVLEESDCQPHRQARGVGTLHFFTESQLLEREAVLRFEFSCADLIGEPSAQVAFDQTVAKVLAGIRVSRQ